MEAEPKAVDPVKVYLDDIGKHPLLDKEQEYELGVAIQSGLKADEALASEQIAELDKATIRDMKRTSAEGLKAQEEMTKSNLRLVVSVAKRICKNTEEYELLDKIQEGNIGLMKAVEKFDPEKGFKFSTYATWWIKQAINRGELGVKGPTRIPTNTNDALTSLNKVEREIKLMHPDLEEVPAEILAEYTNMTPEKIKELRFIAGGLARSVSLHQEFGAEGVNGNGKAKELGDIIPDVTSEEPYDAMLNHVANQEMLKVIDQVLTDPRDQTIMRMRIWGKKTLDEVGKHFGLTRERIRQLERRAHNQLRESPAFQRFTEHELH